MQKVIGGGSLLHIKKLFLSFSRKGQARLPMLCKELQLKPSGSRPHPLLHWNLMKGVGHIRPPAPLLCCQGSPTRQKQPVIVPFCLFFNYTSRNIISQLNIQRRGTQSERTKISLYFHPKFPFTEVNNFFNLMWVHMDFCNAFASDFLNY